MATRFRRASSRRRGVSSAGRPPVTFSTPNALSTTATFTVPGAYTIRLSAFDGEATTSDDVVVTVDPPAGSGTGLLAQYFNDAGSGIYFTALVLTRTDPTVDFDWASDAPDPSRAGRQLLRALERTGHGARDRHLHVHHGFRRWRASLCEWPAAHRQLDRPRASRRTAAPSRSPRGQRYDIRMDFYEQSHAGDGQAVVGVSRARATQIVPQWVLYPAPAGQSTSGGQRRRRPDDLRCPPARRSAASHTTTACRARRT